MPSGDWRFANSANSFIFSSETADSRNGVVCHAGGLTVGSARFSHFPHCPFHFHPTMPGGLEQVKTQKPKVKTGAGCDSAGCCAVILSSSEGSRPACPLTFMPSTSLLTALGCRTIEPSGDWRFVIFKVSKLIHLLFQNCRLPIRGSVAAPTDCA